MLVRSGDVAAFFENICHLLNYHENRSMHVGLPGARFASARVQTSTISSKKWVDIMVSDRDIQAGPSWAGRQGKPKISAMIYQRGGTWDGPSNPIPNVGNA
jgi:hypothetical protein